MKINEDNSDMIFKNDGDEDHNLITQDEQIDINYFTYIIVPKMTRYQYTMLGNIYI